MNEKLKDDIIVALKDNNYPLVLSLINDSVSLHSFFFRYAIGVKNIGFIDFYLKQNLAVDLDYYYLLSFSARTSSPEILTLLLNQTLFNTKENFQAALITAIDSNNIACLNVLLGFVEYPFNGTSLLRQACSTKYTDSINILLSRNFTYDKDFNPFYMLLHNEYFFYYKYTEVLHHLFNVFNLSMNNNEAFKSAQFFNNQDVIKMFWNEACVKSTLMNDCPELYRCFIKLDIQRKINQFL